jgi:hypothetical protein
MTEPLGNPEIWARINPMGKIEKELNLSFKKERRSVKVLEENGSYYLQPEDGAKINGPFAIIIDGIVNHDRSLEFIGDHTVEVAHPNLLKSLVNKKVEVVWESFKQDYYKSWGHVVIFPAEGICF